MTTAQPVARARPDAGSPDAGSPDAARLPDWVQTLSGVAGDERVREHAGDGSRFQVRVLDGRRHGLVSVRIPDAESLPSEEFATAAENAYGAVLDTLTELKASYPVRMWNIIPGILDPLGVLPQRYMVFNTSRYRAFAARSGNRFEEVLPTATGVGNVRGRRDLTIHCLTADRPGDPVENPRQVPAYRYSQRFGPRPPCFSRATAVHLHFEDGRGDGQRLLIGGTASVRGEDSHHLGDLDAQLRETSTNLRALTALLTGSDERWAGRFEHLRVYHRRADDVGAVQQFVAETLPVDGPVETFPVNICRPELMVEIEGVFRPDAALPG